MIGSCFAHVGALVSRVVSRLGLLGVVASAVLIPGFAQAAFSVTPLTWNVIGLDSNSPLSGPRNFPVGARVCSTVAASNIGVNWFWDTANVNVNLRPGSLSTVTIPSLAPGACADAYFEVAITPVAAAYDTARRYHIVAADGVSSASSPTPREVYVEHLISQSRNAITDIKLNGTSIPAGGSMNLLVGNTYAIELDGGTATQGYNQFESFINFPNTIFQILSVSTTYSADNSPYVPGPAPIVNDKLYADACLWQNDPASPNYRSCIGGDYKAGGNDVRTTYTVKIIGGGGTSQSINSLLYDFSGSSYHYNADFGIGARIANVIDPTALTFAKAFLPTPTVAGGTSTLTFTIANPNGGAVSGLSFGDTLPTSPGQMVVATPATYSTSGCGTPTFAPGAGATSIAFSNGTVAANSSCVVSVLVRVPAAPTSGTYANVSGNLFAGGLDTGHNAAANLALTAATPPTNICGLTLAQWTMPPAAGTTVPPLFSFKGSDVATATAVAGAGITSSIDTTIGNPVNAWAAIGFSNAATLTTANNDYFQFAATTTNYTAIGFKFDARLDANLHGPRSLQLYSSTDGTTFTAYGSAISLTATFVTYNPAFTGTANVSGLTYFRIYGYNAGNNGADADLFVDNVTITGCQTAQLPTITKTFLTNPIAVGGTATLRFTLTNPNTAPLTGAKFTDALPAGLQVAASPSASTTCTGSPTWAPAPGDTTLSFGQTTGAVLPASGSCTVSANVTATTAGPHSNVSGFLSTTEGGTNTNSIASATLTAVPPPSITKQFSPSPTLPNGTSTLTFTITNPNQNDAISGVAFVDTFPTSPGAMVVASTPNPTTTGCGAPTFSPVAGAGSITFSGGAIAGGGTCTVTVNVTAPAAGTYNNTSGPVSHVINAQTVNGNTASASLVVNPPNPSIHLLKQVASSNGGPWLPFLAPPVGGQVFYRFTVENTGDVPLLSPAITDNAVDVSSCNAGWSGMTLPVAVPANDNHIVTCVLGPFTATSGSHTNTASVSATFNGNPVNSPNSSATYATTGLTLAKSVTETSYTLPGDQLHYSYLVTNSGFAPLAGPVTVSDDKATVSCPAVGTVGDLDNFLDPGESVTCTATYTIVGADISNASVTNTASASADGVTSNSDSRTVPLSTSADVSLVKTLTTSGPFTVGQSITYTLFVANAGPSTATSIQVTDTPTNLTITNVSGGGCAALPCTIPSLASGANTTITVTATINAAGAFDNSANATAAQPDPNTGNNTDNTGNGGSASASADVSIVKTLTTSGPFVAGQSVIYTLFVANAGPSTATSIQVTDTPTNLTITNVSGGGCAALPCTIPSLASGANTTITVTATINAAGAFDNSATATPAETDPNTGNNTDNSGNNGTASASADVSLVKTLTTSGPFGAGQSITYTLFIANAGPSTATSIQVTDTPTNLSITNVSGGGCAALPCTIPSLASGANTTITVTATITAAGAFDNTATAMPAESDPNLGNNTDSAGNGGTAAASADVSIVKTLVTSGPFSAGQSISYTLLVANAGPSTATSIQVTDTPTNLSITNVSGSGCAALPCTIPSLASGANTTINVTATINAAGAFDNTATATPAEFDPNTSDNTDSTANGGTAVASADVSIVKTLVTSGPFSAGQSISYTLLVANAGPSTATSIQVTDTPTNLTITNVSGSGCAALPCTIASLASGANTTINVTATINAAGAFDNTATATPAESDPNTNDNTDSAGNGGTAAASADVSIVKTLTTSGPFSVGQSVTYTLVVANAGPSTATSVQVTDTPTNLTITNVSGSGCAALPCTIPSLASGANTTITVTATINAAGAFDNSATATPAESDPNLANNTDNTGNAGSAGTSADVSLVKTLTTAGPFTAGQSVSYTLLIANAGPSTATSIQVTDTPINLTITNVSGSGCVALPCTIASLASGVNTTINVTATINAAGAFDNSATATPLEFDPNTSNNTDSTANGGTATASADVSLIKTLVTAGPFSAGQSLTYTLLIANAGPSTATSIQVTDTPANLTITNVSGSGCAALPCTIPSLASGANTTINVTATINANGVFDNSATAMPAESDPNLANNTDNTGNGGTAVAATGVDLAITKTASAPVVAVGQPLDYTLVVTNNGPGTATGVVVTDPLPAAFTLLTASSTQGSCSGTTTVTCNVGTMANGASVTITIHGTANGTGSLSNTATVSANETDGTPANNSSTAGSSAVANIPAIGDVGLILLGLALAFGGVVFMRRS